MVNEIRKDNPMAGITKTLEGCRNRTVRTTIGYRCKAAYLNYVHIIWEDHQTIRNFVARASTMRQECEAVGKIRHRASGKELILYNLTEEETERTETERIDLNNLRTKELAERIA